VFYKMEYSAHLRLLVSEWLSECLDSGQSGFMVSLGQYTELGEDGLGYCWQAKKSKLYISLKT
jgi:hypothetical protein